MEIGRICGTTDLVQSPLTGFCDNVELSVPQNERIS
jgi:hypothetical protein